MALSEGESAQLPCQLSSRLIWCKDVEGMKTNGLVNGDADQQHSHSSPISLCFSQHLEGAGKKKRRETKRDRAKQGGQ